MINVDTKDLAPIPKDWNIPDDAKLMVMNGRNTELILRKETISGASADVDSEYVNRKTMAGAATKVNTVNRHMRNVPSFRVYPKASRNLSILPAPYAAAQMGTNENPNAMAGIISMSSALHPVEYMAIPSTGSTMRMIWFMMSAVMDMTIISMDAGIPTLRMSESMERSKRKPLNGMRTNVSLRT